MADTNFAMPLGTPTDLTHAGTCLDCGDYSSASSITIKIEGYSNKPYMIMAPSGEGSKKDADNSPIYIVYNNISELVAGESIKNTISITGDEVTISFTKIYSSRMLFLVFFETLPDKVTVTSETSAL